MTRKLIAGFALASFGLASTSAIAADVGTVETFSLGLEKAAAAYTIPATALVATGPIVDPTIQVATVQTGISVDEFTIRTLAKQLDAADKTGVLLELVLVKGAYQPADAVTGVTIAVKTLPTFDAKALAADVAGLNTSPQFRMDNAATGASAIALAAASDFSAGEVQGEITGPALATFAVPGISTQDLSVSGVNVANVDASTFGTSGTASPASALEVAAAGAVDGDQVRAGGQLTLLS